MANLAPDDDAAGQTEPIDWEESPDPLQGRVHVSAANSDPNMEKQLIAHLREVGAHVDTTFRYHRGIADQVGEDVADVQPDMNRTVAEKQSLGNLKGLSPHFLFEVGMSPFEALRPSITSPNAPGGDGS